MLRFLFGLKLKKEADGRNFDFQFSECEVMAARKFKSQNHARSNCLQH